jgi:hypothetical protein
MQHFRKYFPNRLVARRRFLVSVVALGALACQAVSANYSPPLAGCRNLALCNLHSDGPSNTSHLENEGNSSGRPGEWGKLFLDRRGDDSLNR